MKKMIAVLTVMLALVATARAALDVYDTVTTKTISTIKLASGTETNAAVDVYGAKGVCNFIVYMGPSVTNSTTSVYTNTATLYTSTASAGTYSIVTNGAGSAVTVSGSATNGTGTNISFKVEAAVLKRYLKLYTSATEPTMIGATLLYSK